MSSKITPKGHCVSIYLPNDLYDAWKASGRNLSRITQAALRARLKEPADAQIPPQDRR